MADAPAISVAPPSGAAPMPVGAPAPAQQQTATRMRVGDMNSILHQTPAPGAELARSDEPQWIADEIPGVGLDGKAQTMGVPDDQQPEVLEASIIGENGETISWEQYQAERAKWLQDDLHEEFHSKFVTAVIDGRKYRVPISEAVAGYQRNADYSNGMAEVAAGKRENDRTRQGFLNVLADMNGGESFLRMVRSLGKEEGFQQAAKLYALQWNAERQMTPQQRAVMDHARKLERENYQLKMQQRQLEQVTQQQRPPDQQQQYIHHQLSQMVPAAARKVNLPWSPLAEQQIDLHFAQMGPEHFRKGGELDTNFVMRVIMAAKETVEDTVAKSNAVLAQQMPAPPPVQRLPGAAPAGSATQQPNGKPTRMRVGDMNRVLTQPRR